MPAREREGGSAATADTELYPTHLIFRPIYRSAQSIVGGKMQPTVVRVHSA